jgi:membrane protease YdiL (CAAX protease family)
VNFTTIPWDFCLILAVLGIAIPWRGKVRVERLMMREDLGASGRLWLYASTICYQWVIATLVLWRALARGMHPNDLGLTISDPWRAAWMTISLTALLCAGQFAGLRKMARIPAGGRGQMFGIMEKIMPRTWKEIVVFAALATTAGLSEEFLYRGFLLTLFATMFTNLAGSALLASCASSIWFSVAHLYQGRRGIITTFVVGMIFATIRISSGSLLPSIVAHASVDLLAGICIPRLLKKAR